MKMRWTHFLKTAVILFFFSVSAAIEVEDADEIERNCSYNFFSYQINTDDVSKTMCAYIPSERLTWDAAKVHCNLLFSQLNQRIYLKTFLRLELAEKGIDVLWLGIRRRADFFVTEYPSKLFREADSFSRDHWGYHWSDDEPTLNDCVALNTSSGSLHTHNCSAHLPFVCDADSKITSTVSKDLACPDGWSVSFPLSTVERTCISLYEANTYNNAENICHLFDGQMATSKEYAIIFSGNSFSSFKTETFWTKRRNSGFCPFMENDTIWISRENCTQKNPFICVKRFKSKNINVNLSPSVIKPIPSHSKDELDLLSCDIETEATEINIKKEVLFQWYKDDLPITGNADVIRLTSVDDSLKRDPYVSDIATRQGHYHCTVQLPGLAELYVSSKMKFFYSDISAYVVEIVGIKPEKFLDYSKEDFYNNMDELSEASISIVLGKILDRYPQVEWDFMSKSLQNGVGVMKIMIYFYRNAVKSFDDSMACEELKEAFEELQSIPVFMENISIDVNCKDYSVKNGYTKVVKSLEAVETQLSRIEDTQGVILEKLQLFEKSRCITPLPTQHNYEFFVTSLLKVVGDLKRLEKELFDAKVRNVNVDNTFGQRERNEFEDDLEATLEKKYFAASELTKKIGIFKTSGKNSKLKAGGFIEELKKNYAYFPGERKNAVPERIHFEKDL